MSEGWDAEQLLERTKTLLLRRLKAVAAVVRKLHHYANQNRVDGVACSSAGTRWELFRCVLENEVYARLPRAVREALNEGEDAIRNAWVLSFRPRSPEAINGFYPHTQREIAESGGWRKYVCRTTTWSVAYKTPYRPLTIRDFLKCSDWECDWQAAERAVENAEAVFDKFGRRRRPSRRRLKKCVLDHVAGLHPTWIPQSRQPLAPDVERALGTGVYAPPKALEDLEMKAIILAQFWPHDVELELAEVLTSLLKSDDLHLRELNGKWYYTLGKRPKPKAVPAGESPEALLASIPP